MAESSTSQVQHGVEAFRKIAEEQVKRTTALLEEGRRFEERWLEQGNQVVDESARLMKGALVYSVQMAAEWRRLTQEAFERGLALLPGRNQA